MSVDEMNSGKIGVVLRTLLTMIASIPYISLDSLADLHSYHRLKQISKYLLLIS